MAKYAKGLSLAVLAFVGLSLPSIAQAGPVRASASDPTDTPSLITIGYRRSLLALRTAVERQTTLDGGTLSPSHAAHFDARLHRINDLYLRTLNNRNPLSVDATGMPVKQHAQTDWTHSDLLNVGASE